MEKEKIVCIVAKGPIPFKGRIFPLKLRNLQNWYRSCVKAVKVFKKQNCSKIIVSTNFKTPKEGYEMNYYSNALSHIMTSGIPCHLFLGDEYLEEIYEGADTIIQLNAAFKYADEHNSDIILVWGRI